jgi:hypothetical protein
VCVGIAVVIGYAFRVAALDEGWEKPLASEPTGVYRHTSGRPLLGRKLDDKSVREMRDLGLTVEKDSNGGAKVSEAPSTAARS